MGVKSIFPIINGLVGVGLGFLLLQLLKRFAPKLMFLLHATVLTSSHGSRDRELYSVDKLKPRLEPGECPPFLVLFMVIISAAGLITEFSLMATGNKLISNRVWAMVGSYAPIAWFGGMVTLAIVMAILVYSKPPWIRFVFVGWLIVFVHFFWQASTVYAPDAPRKTEASVESETSGGGSKTNSETNRPQLLTGPNVVTLEPAKGEFDYKNASHDQGFTAGKFRDDFKSGYCTVSVKNTSKIAIKSFHIHLDVFRKMPMEDIPADMHFTYDKAIDPDEIVYLNCHVGSYELARSQRALALFK